MMGLFIGAWAGLPIEAVVVWIAVTYATTIVYEIVKVWRASGKDAKHAFLGKSSVGRNRSGGMSAIVRGDLPEVSGPPVAGS
jgi:hypothetical protein